MLYKNAADQLKSVFLRTLLPVLAAGVLALSPAAQVNASRLSDLKQQKSQTQEKLNAANNKSDSLEGQEEALSEAEAAVSQDLVQNMASVQMLEQEIDKLNTQIDEKQKEYDAAKAKEDHQYELMKIRIKYMYEKGNTDYVEILMHATSLTDMLNKSEYISKLYDYDRKLLKEYQETRRQTAAAKTALVDKKSEQEESKAGLVEEQSALQSQISDLKAKHSNVNAQIEEARRQASALAQQLQEQTAAISAEVEAQAKAAEEARKKAEAEAAAKKAAQEALDKSKTSNTQNSVKAVNGSSLPVVENSSSQDAADSSGSSDIWQLRFVRQLQFIRYFRTGHCCLCIPVPWEPLCVRRHQPDQRNGLFRFYAECIFAFRIFSRPYRCFAKKQRHCGCLPCRRKTGRSDLLPGPCSHLLRKRNDHSREYAGDRH